MEARKHRAPAFTKKHRPFQKGQTAGATSGRRHVSTSNISLLSFFQCKIHYYHSSNNPVLSFFQCNNYYYHCSNISLLSVSRMQQFYYYHSSTCRMDCAFYMYMNVKHYFKDGTTAALEAEQVPELRKKIIYQLIS
jgi:hypothetical protein